MVLASQDASSLTATHCSTLQHTATCISTCILLYETRCRLAVLEYFITHCNILQHTATHCNTLQHTATHCNKYRMLIAYVSVASLHMSCCHAEAFGENPDFRNNMKNWCDTVRYMSIMHDTSSSKACCSVTQCRSRTTPRVQMHVAVHCVLQCVAVAENCNVLHLEFKPFTSHIWMH